MIILASNSPRRKELLKQLDIPFKVVVSMYDETQITDFNPIERVKKLAFGKANSIYKQCPKTNDLILAADTIVYYKGIAFNKPKNRKEAFKMLSSLSGNKHQVYTGICIIYHHKLIIDYAKTDVYFKVLTPQIINAYLDTNEPYDKAGAYAIQGIANTFIKEIKGEESNVIGLPLSLVEKYFLQLGIINEKING